MWTTRPDLFWFADQVCSLKECRSNEMIGRWDHISQCIGKDDAPEFHRTPKKDGPMFHHFQLPIDTMKPNLFYRILLVETSPGELRLWSSL